VLIGTNRGRGIRFTIAPKGCDPPAFIGTAIGTTGRVDRDKARFDRDGWKGQEGIHIKSSSMKSSQEKQGATGPENRHLAGGDGRAGTHRKQAAHEWKRAGVAGRAAIAAQAVRVRSGGRLDKP
jgi:hypothetical protein